MFRKFIYLLLIIGSFVPVIWGQDAPNLNSQAQLIHYIRIQLGLNSFSNTFWAAKSTSLHLSILLPTSDYSLTLRDPLGTIFILPLNGAMNAPNLGSLALTYASSFRPLTTT